MKKILLYFTILVIPILSCRNNTNEFRNKYTLRPSNDSIVIKISDNSKNLANHLQYFRENNTNYLALSNLDENSIDIYNLDSKNLFRTIKIQKEGDNSFGEMMGFFVAGLDSILLISLSPKIIGITDTGGAVSKKIPFDEDINRKRVKTTIPWAGQRPFFIGNTLHLGQIWDSRESMGILTETALKNTSVGISINIRSGECRSSGLTYPEELIGENISLMPVVRVSGYENSFIYHFALLNDLFVTNDHKNFKTVPLESNYTLKFSSLQETEIVKGLNDKISHDEILNILYDEYRERYYVVIRKRTENSADAPPLNGLLYPDCFILILDKSLRHEGEVFFPDHVYSFKMIFVTQKGLL